MPRGHEHVPIIILAQCVRALLGLFFPLSFPRKRLQWEKKIVVPCLDVIRLPFSSEMYSEVVFLPEKRALILSECPLGNPYTP